MPRRRNFNAEFKAKVVLDLISGSKSAAELCREHELKPDLLSHWKSQFVVNAAKAFDNAKEVDPQQERIAELERLAGKQSLEIEILKKALKLLPRRSKPDVS